MTRETELPDFITEGADGTLTVDLLRGITVDGTPQKSLTLREPCVDDMLAAEKTAKSDTAMSEVILIANLAGVDPAAIRSAKMRDYSRLQEALGFMNG